MTGYRRLWLLLEGSDDEQFARAVLIPVFMRLYNHVDIWQYSQRSKEERAGVMRSIRAMNTDYVLLCDIDEHPCVTAKKETMKTDWSSLSGDRIAVVVKEIESWYLAGLDERDFQDLRIREVNRPDEVVKEDFDALIGGRINRIDIMIEILKRYKLSEARRRSPSFGYFAGKHLPNSASG